MIPRTWQLSRGKPVDHGPVWGPCGFLVKKEHFKEVLLPVVRSCPGRLRTIIPRKPGGKGNAVKLVRRGRLQKSNGLRRVRSAGGPPANVPRRPGLFEVDVLFLDDLEGLVGLDEPRDAPELAHALDLGVEQVVHVVVEHDDVAGLERKELATGDLGPAKAHHQLHRRFHEPLLEPGDPGVVDFQAFGLERGVELGADGLDGGVGQADDQRTDGVFEFHLEGDHHHHVAWRHDGRELRIDFAAHELDMHLVDRLPGLLHVLQGDAHHPVDDGLFDGGEVAALDLGLGAGPAEKALHHGEDESRIHDQDGVAAQGIELEDVDGGGDGQRAHEVAELGHVDGNGVDVGAFAHGVGHGVGGQPGEPVVDDFQDRHAAPDDAVLVGQVENHNPGVVLQDVGLGFDLATGKAAQQRIDLVLIQNLAHVRTFRPDLSETIEPSARNEKGPAINGNRPPAGGRFPFTRRVSGHPVRRLPATSGPCRARAVRRPGNRGRQARAARVAAG